MESKKQKVSFKHFLSKFPKIDLPVTITEGSHHVFSENNLPMPLLMIHQILGPIEGDVEDEFTEFVPCFSIPETHGFYAVVYWKASLLTYEYILCSFTKKGELIDRKVIAGTKVEDNKMVKSLAKINEDWSIQVIGGVSEENIDYDATQTRKIELELLPDGKIAPSI